MHHPKHSRVVWNYRAAALLLLLKYLLAGSALGFCLVPLFQQDTAAAFRGLILFGLSILCGLLQRMFSAGAKCPLCMMPPLGRRGCAKHQRARKLLGSYRLPTALSVLFLGRLRCPYCNEPIRLKVKSGARRK